jgi:hypothetical protein
MPKDDTIYDGKPKRKSSKKKTNYRTGGGNGEA